MNDTESPAGRATPAPPALPDPAGDQRQPVFNVPPVTLALVLAMAAGFAGLQLAPEAWAVPIVHRLSVVPAEIRDAVTAPVGAGAVLGEAATLVTHAFIHVDPLHFAINAGFLLAFGSACERVMGGARFLTLFLVSAAAGAAVQIAADWGQVLLMFGASGGVSGCMGGIARLLLADRTDPRRRRFAFNLIVVLFLMNLLLGAFGGALLGVDAEIAWQAHIGGFVAGFLLARRAPHVDIMV